MPSGIRCPVGNDCLKTNVVYKATVQHKNKISNYIGMTENSFKTRYTQHKSSSSTAEIGHRQSCLA